MVGEHRPRRRTSRAIHEHVMRHSRTRHALRHASYVVRRVSCADFCIGHRYKIFNVLKIYAKYYVQCIEFLNGGYATVSLLLELIMSC